MKSGGINAYCRGLALSDFGHHLVSGSLSPSTIESRDTRPRRMPVVYSLYTGSRALPAEYCIVGIQYNTAI